MSISKITSMNVAADSAGTGLKFTMNADAAPGSGVTQYFQLFLESKEKSIGGGSPVAWTSADGTSKDFEVALSDFVAFGAHDGQSVMMELMEVNSAGEPLGLSGAKFLPHTDNEAYPVLVGLEVTHGGSAPYAPTSVDGIERKTGGGASYAPKGIRSGQLKKINPFGQGWELELDAYMDLDSIMDKLQLQEEKAGRESADQALTNNLNSEIAARQSGDNALDARLDVVEGSSSTAGSIAKAQFDLQAVLDKHEAAMGAVVDSSGDYVAFSGKNFINGNSDVAQDLIDLDAAIQVVKDDLAAAGGTTLGSRVTALEARDLPVWEDKGAGITGNGSNLTDVLAAISISSPSGTQPAEHELWVNGVLAAIYIYDATLNSGSGGFEWRKMAPEFIAATDFVFYKKMG
jgi:hypothetical protein